MNYFHYRLGFDSVLHRLFNFLLYCFRCSLLLEKSLRKRLFFVALTANLFGFLLISTCIVLISLVIVNQFGL